MMCQTMGVTSRHRARRGFSEEKRKPGAAEEVALNVDTLTASAKDLGVKHHVTCVGINIIVP